MSDSESKPRTVVITFFPMFIATLSLVTSIYNGYLNGKFVDLIQRNFGRGEYIRTCKEIIDAYFQVKFRAGVVSENGERERASGKPVTTINPPTRSLFLGLFSSPKNCRSSSWRRPLAL